MHSFLKYLISISFIALVGCANNNFTNSSTSKRALRVDLVESVSFLSESKEARDISGALVSVLKLEITCKGNLASQDSEYADHYSCELRPHVSSTLQDGLQETFSESCLFDIQFTKENKMPLCNILGDNRYANLSVAPDLFLNKEDVLSARAQVRIIDLAVAEESDLDWGLVDFEAQSKSLSAYPVYEENSKEESLEKE